MIRPQWMVISQAGPVDTQSDFDQGNFKAGSTLKALYHVPLVAELFAQWQHCPAGETNEMSVRWCSR